MTTLVKYTEAHIIKVHNLPQKVELVVINYYLTRYFID